MARNRFLSFVERLLLGGAAARAATDVAADAAVHGIPEGEPRHPSVRYEPVDVNSRNVLLTGVGVLGGTLLAGVIIFPLFAWLVAHRAEVNEPPLPSTAGRTQYPPQPRLQQNPTLDLESMRRMEEGLLNSTRWVDRAHGVVSIPIDRAMQLTVQRGIPPRPAPPGNVYYDPREGSRETGFDLRPSREVQ